MQLSCFRLSMALHISSFLPEKWVDKGLPGRSTENQPSTSKSILLFKVQCAAHGSSRFLLFLLVADHFGMVVLPQQSRYRPCCVCPPRVQDDHLCSSARGDFSGGVRVCLSHTKHILFVSLQQVH